LALAEKQLFGDHVIMERFRRQGHF